MPSVGDAGRRPGRSPGGRASAGKATAAARRRAESRRRALQSLQDAGADPHSWAACADRLAGCDAGVAAEFTALTPSACERWSPENVRLWGRQAEDALSRGEAAASIRSVRAYLRASVHWHADVPLKRWPDHLERVRRIALVSPPAADAFLRHGVYVCRHLTPEETDQWVEAGLRNAGRPAALSAWFNGTSPQALHARDALRKSVLLEDCRPVLSLLIQAFLGRPVPIQPGAAGAGATDGRVVYLPDAAPTQARFQLAALHQAVLMERIQREPDLGWMRTAPRDAHLRADRDLVSRLPGMRRKMHAEARVDDGYPERPEAASGRRPPWWGELLPDRVRQTTETFRTLRERAETDAALSPETVESLTASLLARGERDADALWAWLQQMGREQFASPGPEDLPPEVKTRTWPEWDDVAGGYRPDWCLVRELAGDESPNDYVERQRLRHAGLIRLLRRRFLQLKPEKLHKRKAHSLGDDLDPDALIAAVVDRRAGAELNDNVYIHRRKNRRDVASLFLLDVSASTGETAAGRRVIDIQKEALVLMTAALEALGDRYAVYGFRSEGRFRVDMVTVKSFFEPFGEGCAARIGNMEPDGFTRLGAGIRHAAHLLEAVAARVKLLIVFSDGRPYDYEYGDLDYAVADCRAAMDGLGSDGVHPFVITSDREGAGYIERMAPAAASVILPRVERLPDLLPRLYRRLTV